MDYNNNVGKMLNSSMSAQVGMYMAQDTAIALQDPRNLETPQK